MWFSNSLAMKMVCIAHTSTVLHEIKVDRTKAGRGGLQAAESLAVLKPCAATVVTLYTQEQLNLGNAKTFHNCQVGSMLTTR